MIFLFPFYPKNELTISLELLLFIYYGLTMTINNCYKLTTRAQRVVLQVAHAYSLDFDIKCGNVLLNGSSCSCVERSYSVC